MRDDYPKFKALGAEIVVVTRHAADKMKAFWAEQTLPYPGVADPEGEITARFGQQWKLHKLGRMPAQIVVDCLGAVELAHYGGGMSDILTNDQILSTLRKISCNGAPAKANAVTDARRGEAAR